MGFWYDFFLDAGLPVGVSAEYSEIFEDNRIQRSMIGDISKDLLNELGVTTVGDVIAILKHVRKRHKREKFFEPEADHKSTRPHTNPVENKSTVLFSGFADKSLKRSIENVSSDDESDVAGKKRRIIAKKTSGSTSKTDPSAIIRRKLKEAGSSDVSALRREFIEETHSSRKVSPIVKRINPSSSHNVTRVVVENSRRRVLGLKPKEKLQTDIAKQWMMKSLPQEMRRSQTTNVHKRLGAKSQNLSISERLGSRPSSRANDSVIHTVDEFGRTIRITETQTHPKNNVLHRLGDNKDMKNKKISVGIFSRDSNSHSKNDDLGNVFSRLGSENSSFKGQGLYSDRITPSIKRRIVNTVF